MNKPSTPYVDQVFSYLYNANDQVTSETLDNGINGTGVDQTTTYGWTGTQQTSKAVNVPSTSTVTQNMSYGLTGQLEKVITTNQNGTGTVTARTQVEYRYDNTGIRFIAIDTTDTNLATAAVDGSPTGRTEYLIDHANFTGYQQTIIETVRNASGVATKRTSYTFGVDEITQTVSNLNPDGSVNGTPTTHTFGHDGHGSTRVLFGAAAAIAQVFTYSAYGELLAIHNGAGTLQPITSSLTSVLYNGEGFDARTGLYNMRARWYSASNARWERLDPYSGNPTDPFSFNKYGFTSGDPILHNDPTGLFEGLSGMLGSMSIQSGMQRLSAYTIRVAGQSALETLFEGIIASLISAVFNVENEFDSERTFKTNFAANYATFGLSGAKYAKLLFEFVIRTIGDIAYGESVGWAIGVNAIALGSPAIASMGAKAAKKAFSLAPSTGAGEVIESATHLPRNGKRVSIQQQPMACAPTCGQMVLVDAGLHGIDASDLGKLAGTTIESGTRGPNLAKALRASGLRDARHVRTATVDNLDTWTRSGHPTIVSVPSNGPTGYHAIIVDGVTRRPGLSPERLVAIRDPGTGSQSFIKESEFSQLLGGGGGVIITKPLPSSI